MSETPLLASLDGELVPFADARLHVLAPAVAYGATVFEGVRGYWSESRGDCMLFRLDDHLSRLDFAMKVMRYNTDLNAATIKRWTRELVRANRQRDGIHIRILVYVAGGGTMFTREPISCAIVSLPRAEADGARNGVHACVSSWRRLSDTAMPPRVKCASNYQNGRLAALQAKDDRYDVALLLNGRGHLAEAPGSCLFIVRNGKLVTPAVSDDILEGITRDTIMTLARDDLGIEVEERSIDRTELYAADEAFLCGTASEIQPILSVDRLPLGTGVAGPVTERLKAAFADLVRGRSGRSEWLNPVYEDNRSAM